MRHRTILNLSCCSEAEIKALKLAFKHKDKLAVLMSTGDVVATVGKRVGAVFALHRVAEELGLPAALGQERQGRLALLQVLARMINQGSRLSAVRLAQSHALCEILGIDKLDEDDLYENLAWLEERQETIEKLLFAKRFQAKAPTLFLYDVTSSYLEGECNELAAYGYNRDRKRGKRQIVVGLLTDPDGLPVAIRVFEGNTDDPKTVTAQVKVLAENFGVKEVTIVGDRGMLKGPQIDALPDNFRYITAITKPQIRKMLTEGVMQLGLFTDKVCEGEVDGIRFVLRRKPVRAEEMRGSRDSKFAAMLATAEKLTRYLAEHPRADAAKALARAVAKAKRLKTDAWLRVTEKDRAICVDKDPAALAEAALIDGCYAIKSDVPKASADTQTLHDRYCDLENVERAFRTMTTAHLDLRPIFVRKASSTRGHVFVVMLALLVQRELECCWRELDITVQEGVDELGAICALDLCFGEATINTIPLPNPRAANLLETLSVSMPRALSFTCPRVHTKKKLCAERIH